MNNDELMHYGVLGMKWGVRRNARVLAAHNRNSSIKSIKKQRKTGEISKSESRLAVKKAKKNFKTERRQLVKSVNSKDAAKSLKSKTISEVKHSTLKKRSTCDKSYTYSCFSRDSWEFYGCCCRNGGRAWSGWCCFRNYGIDCECSCYGWCYR